MAQHPLRSIQLWEIHHSPGEIIPVADCSHSEKLSSCVHSEFPLEKLVPIIPCPFHAIFVKVESIFFVTAPLILEHGDKVSSKPSFLKAEQTQFSKAFLIWQASYMWNIWLIFFNWQTSVCYKGCFCQPFCYSVHLGAEQRCPAQCIALKRPCPSVCKN